MKASELFVPGMWQCPQCGFTQHNNVISPASMFASTKPELRACPNDGRDLQPVKWQERAEDVLRTFGRVMDELTACKARSVTWRDVLVDKPGRCEPVIGYSPDWECEDFNAAGTRECFLTDEGNWMSAKWDNDQDCWQTDETTAPTQWMNLVGMTPSKIFQHGVSSACHEGTGWVLYNADGEPFEEWPKGWPETVTTAWLRSRGVEVGV